MTDKVMTDRSVKRAEDMVSRLGALGFNADNLKVVANIYPDYCATYYKEACDVINDLLDLVLEMQSELEAYYD